MNCFENVFVGCLDEISLGLSPKIINTLYKTIKEINAEGVSILLVEQALRRALKFANRAYVIEKGKIAWEGDRSVFNEYKLRKNILGYLKPLTLWSSRLRCCFSLKWFFQLKP
jgi:ABC-type branched-subunit amino acid transport system ATPase component